MDCTSGDLDRLSALPDDLLHVILGRLGFAPTVTKTAVLSRRWRHVWTQAKSLTFKDDDTYLKRKRDFVGFVDWVLAQRDDAAMESLEIKFNLKGRTSTAEKINEWLRYAAQRVVRVDFDLGPLELDQQVIEFPSHGRATSISLDLSYNRFRLPDVAVASYQSLRKLRLMSLEFDEFEERSTIGDFVASCCPRLRRLSIMDAKGMPRLVLRTEVLEKLYISADDLQMLDVVAPKLRIIKLNCCSDAVVRIVAPRLEQINGSFPSKLPDLYIHDLKSVRRLKRLWLDMHGKYLGDGDDAFWLLQNCTGVQEVDMSVHHEHTMDELLDLTSEGKALFANVRTMSVKASFLPKHHLLASVSALLLRFPKLTSLSVDTFAAERQSWGTCPCCEALTDRYTIHRKIALESLQDVKITGFGGTDEEMQLVSLLFDSSNSVKSMSIALVRTPPKSKKQLDALSWQHWIGAEAAETIYHELMKIPCADLGHWRFVKRRKQPRRTFTWTRDTTHQRRRHAEETAGHLPVECRYTWRVWDAVAHWIAKPMLRPSQWPQTTYVLQWWTTLPALLKKWALSRACLLKKK